MSSTSKSLVMGFAAGLPAAEVTPFFRSLRSVGYRGTSCLFVARTSDAAVAELSVMTRVFRLDAEYPPVVSPRTVALLRRARNTPRVRRVYPTLFRLASMGFGPAATRLRRRDLEYKLEGLQSLRYGHYLDYLDGPGADADFVMVSDIRDVLFQADPFDGAVGELEVFLEADHVTVGAEPFNRRWIRQLYGRRRLAKLAAVTVSCSGVTLGTRSGMRRYLRLMCHELAGPRRPMGSHDQGVHNHLLRSGRLDPVRICPNERGRVITVGLQRQVVTNEARQIVNGDGSLPAVVHQYDRYPDLAVRLRESVVDEGPTAFQVAQPT